MVRIDGNGNDPLYGLLKKGKVEQPNNPNPVEKTVPVGETGAVDAGKKLTLDEENNFYSSMGVKITKVSAEDTKEIEQLTKLARTQLNLPKLETPYLTKACYAQYELAAKAFTETIAADFGQNHPGKNARALALRPEMASLNAIMGLEDVAHNEAMMTLDQEAWGDGPFSLAV